MGPRQIGITGGIGAGKSLVSRIFSTLGIPVYDADSRAKYVMTTDGILISGIRKEFGELSYHRDGQLNRTFIGEQVFQNPERLAVLNNLVHPRVEVDYREWVRGLSTHRYVIKEAALLLETGSYKRLDDVILVLAPEELRIKRVLKRDPDRSLTQIKEIMSRQMPDEEKTKLANIVIRNDESQLLIPQVLKLHEQFSRF